MRAQGAAYRGVSEHFGDQHRIDVTPESQAGEDRGGGWVATSACSRAGFMCGSIAFSYRSWTLGQRVNTGSECRTIAATVRARR